ncbi:MAG: hypothetical protein IT324_25090, partial [Anaerolineae bacterium]|nr:hypothetical protein [Anaerolineae bacterium]
NRFQLGDYRRSAALYRRLKPDVILAGHAEPCWVTAKYLDMIEARAEEVDRLHRELLPLDVVDRGLDDSVARIHPYQLTACGGETLTLTVEVRNPFAQEDYALVKLIAPANWHVIEPELCIPVAAHAPAVVTFHVLVPAGVQVNRARLSADVTIGRQRFGQQGETVVTVV